MIMGGVFCQNCTDKHRAKQGEDEQRRCAAEQQALQAKRDGVVEAMRTELAEKAPIESNTQYAAKLEALRDLVREGTLTTSEFDDLKSTLLQHWSQGEQHGRFAEMYGQAKDLISQCLVAPATAKYQPLDPSMIVFIDCESNQFVFNTYVDSQARSSALLRSQFRVKFDLETDKCVGISLFQDVNPPYQKMEWGPYTLGKLNAH